MLWQCLQKELEDGEEKKDKPEKAASTSGSAENEPAADVADVTIEEITVIEVTPDDAKPVEAGVMHGFLTVVQRVTRRPPFVFCQQYICI